jgi:hypothetical protein
LATDDFKALTTAQIAAIDVADISSLSTAQLSVLTGSQESAFTAAQMAVMTPEQLAEITTSPLILDLNGDGAQTLSRAANVYFDIDASGERISTGWVGQGDGLLALDRNGDGTIGDGSELFGNATQLADGSRASDGFAALADLDSNHDGRISLDDSSFASLRVWMDANQDGVSQAAELYSLSSLGIASINLDAEQVSILNNGNWIGQSSSYETVDGQVHSIVDAWFRTGSSDGQSIDLTALDPQVISEHSLSQINLGGDGGVATHLTLDAESVGRFGQIGLANTGLGASTPVQMMINGDAGDTVQVHAVANEWQDVGTAQVDGTLYNVYNDGDIQLLVATSVHTSFYS